jgi:hypothetical protein
VLASATSIQSAIQSRIRAPKTPRVWTADDFADLGSRSAVDLALHRLASTRDVRSGDNDMRIIRGKNRTYAKVYELTRIPNFARLGVERQEPKVLLGHLSAISKRDDNTVASEYNAASRCKDRLCLRV